MNKKKIVALGLTVIFLVGTLAGCGSSKKSDSSGSKTIEITNVQYDPTRELYEAYNPAFEKYWKEKTGQDVEITQSHGGSGLGHVL